MQPLLDRARRHQFDDILDERHFMHVPYLS